jgi:hypothetical protein
MSFKIDMKEFWEVNKYCLPPQEESPRVPVSIHFVVIFGQILPLKILLSGTPEEVIAFAKRDIEQAGVTRQLVLTTAGSISPGTRFENLIKEGGYIPCCYHGVPPDVSWKNYIEFTRMLAKLSDWL